MTLVAACSGGAGAPPRPLPPAAEPATAPVPAAARNLELAGPGGPVLVPDEDTDPATGLAWATLTGRNEVVQPAAGAASVTEASAV